MILSAKTLEDHLKYSHWRIMMFSILVSCLLVTDHLQQVLCISKCHLPPPIWNHCGPSNSSVSEAHARVSIWKEDSTILPAGLDTLFVIGSVRVQVCLSLKNLLRPIYSKTYTLFPSFFLPIWQPWGKFLFEECQNYTLAMVINLIRSLFLRLANFPWYLADSCFVSYVVLQVNLNTTTDVKPRGRWLKFSWVNWTSVLLVSAQRNKIRFT